MFRALYRGDRSDLLRSVYEAQEAKLSILDPLPACETCGLDVRPIDGVEKCVDCGAPAPMPCCFCGDLFTPERAGRAKWCSDHCRDAAKEYAAADRTPPSLRPVQKPRQPDAHNVRPLLKEVEIVLDSRRERWQEGMTQNGHPAQLADLWHRVRLGRAGAPLDGPNAWPGEKKCCRICSRPLGDRELKKRRARCEDCDPPGKRERKRSAPVVLYEGIFAAIEEPPADPSLAAAEYRSSAALTRSKRRAK